MQTQSIGFQGKSSPGGNNQSGCLKVGLRNLSSDCSKCKYLNCESTHLLESIQRNLLFLSIMNVGNTFCSYHVLAMPVLTFDSLNHETILTFNHPNTGGPQHYSMCSHIKTLNRSNATNRIVIGLESQRSGQAWKAWNRRNL